MITVTINILPEAPLRSQTANEAEYRTKVENFLQALVDFSSKLNTFITQLNQTQNEINQTQRDCETTYANLVSYADSTKTTLQDYVSQANAAKTVAQGYRNEAVQKANFIASYTIPTEATYSKEAIEDGFNAIIATNVALAAQIAVLHKNQIQGVS